MSAGPTAPPASRRRAGARVEGTVQGVGFRPYVHRLATELELAGFVLNDERGVLLEVEGPPEAVERFLARLPAEAPPLAAIERVVAASLEPVGARGFEIVGSRRAGEPEALVSPDAATCLECLAELFDPADRRFRYPFINCTNCGPRFTIVRGVPYDRRLTTMAGFAMCERCRSEFSDPLDRRFHAQPNACPECGPAVRLTDAKGRELAEEGNRDPIALAADALASGLIVAVKGLGGFHLACRADDERAVAKLRSRKRREDKPFALMAPNLEAARSLVELTADEEALLLGRERPIVIAPRRVPGPDTGAPVATAVAPRSSDLGVMLPYTPLHRLLLSDSGATLVMTSGNVSDEPIAYIDDEALRRLGAIADRFLLHDRPIHVRTDDSVVRIVAPTGRRRALLLRRSRGYAPAGVDLPLESERPLLACGAELKSTFCVAKGTRAWLGHHIGDLRNYETLSAFRDGIEHFERLFAVEPEVIVHDLHPDYLSTAYALEREGAAHLGVQHHHAHLAACLAEHDFGGEAVGAIFDGAGYGPDGAVWGGELLFGGLSDFVRAGHLRAVRMPGGEQAVREPWRMACAWLVDALETVPEVPPLLAGAVDRVTWRRVAELAGSGLASPLTTSVGRLFDAVAALCGTRAHVSYEGQAAVELEAAASACARERRAYPLPIEVRTDRLVLDGRETVLAIVRDLAEDTPAPVVAARFHNGLGAATAAACIRLAERFGVEAVALSGGVFQNRLLLERTSTLLSDAGLRVLIPTLLPPNDGSIAYGQAAVAAARLAGAKAG